MVRKTTPPEDIFFNSLSTMIKNMFIDDVNYKTGYYHESGNSVVSINKEKAQWILDKMEDWKHLIKCDCHGK